MQPSLLSTPALPYASNPFCFLLTQHFHTSGWRLSWSSVSPMKPAEPRAHQYCDGTDSPIECVCVYSCRHIYAYNFFQQRVEFSPLLTVITLQTGTCCSTTVSPLPVTRFSTTHSLSRGPFSAAATLTNEPARAGPTAPCAWVSSLVARGPRGSGSEVQCEDPTRG